MLENKNKLVQTRLTQQEYERFQLNLQETGMDQSTYLRTLIAQREISTVNHSREIMEKVCDLYKILNSQEFDGYEAAMEALEQVCLLLK